MKILFTRRPADGGVIMATRNFQNHLEPDASKAFVGADLTLTVTAAEIESPRSFLFRAGSPAKTEPWSSAWSTVGSCAACSWSHFLAS